MLEFHIFILSVSLTASKDLDYWAQIAWSTILCAFGSSFRVSKEHLVLFITANKLENWKQAWN